MDLQTDLPFVTGDLPGVGGEIKRRAADFRVEEIPLYEPDEEGQHVYVRLTRQEETTRQVVDRLSNLFAIRKGAIGYAGMKDKEARTTQNFSLDLPHTNADGVDEIADRLEDETAWKIEWVRRHRNKLRRGHLIGNRFSIVLAEPEGTVDQARAVAEGLIERGVPNFYGAQRFGRDGDNAEEGRAIVEGEGFDGPHWKRRFLCNAFQSELYNRWLVARIERGWFDRLLEGDVAKKTDTGGLFEVKEIDDEQPRFDRREITFTGPIYGDDLWWAEGEPGELEETILEESGVGVDALGRAGLSGSRRRGRIHLDELTVEEDERGICLSFALPKGAYATVVLREFVAREK
jgi:tRNA pseudouridine13 synthase